MLFSIFLCPGDYTTNYFDDGGDDFGDEEDVLEDRDGPSY